MSDFRSVSMLIITMWAGGVPPSNTSGEAPSASAQRTQRATLDGDDARFRGLLAKKSLLHEIEESVVALDLLLAWLARRPRVDAAAADDDASRVTVVDLCCGKAIFSGLLAHLAPRRPELFAARGVRGVIAVDKVRARFHARAAPRAARPSRR